MAGATDQSRLLDGIWTLILDGIEERAAIGEKGLEPGRVPTKTSGARAMKFVTLTALAVLLSAGYAIAGGGAPVPKGSQADAPSGRPSAVLDDAACQSVWKMASPNGDTLAGDKAVPYILNFEMVDTDTDGTISAAEFKTGCGKGWVQNADAATTKEMNPSPKL